MAITITNNTGTNIGGPVVSVNGVDVMTELATLRAENERLREALNKVWNYSETGSMIESVCEEAMK